MIYSKKNEILKEQNKKQSFTIGQYQTSQLTDSERIHNLEEENGRYWEQIGELENKCEKLQERNNNQAETIRSYRTGEETKKLLKQIDELFNKYGELEKDYKKYRAISQNQQKNAAETLSGLIIERDNALEQRKADWERIHSLEADVDNLRGEIIALRNRSDG